jgi:hypothetical protein
LVAGEPFMSWEKRNWAHYPKHAAKGSRPWPEQIKKTRNGVAIYKKGVNLNQQQIETAALPPGGHLIIEQENRRIYYREFSYIIGASKGEPTRIVRVQHDGDPLGSYHGYPITETELICELTEHNPEELVSYRKRKLESRKSKK